MDFYGRGRDYSISLLGGDEKTGDKFRQMLPTIQFEQDIEASYREVKSKYEGKENTGFPKELLLLSMMSLKRPTVEQAEELLQIMKDKNYSAYGIEFLEEDLEKLRESESNTNQPITPN